MHWLAWEEQSNWLCIIKGASTAWLCMENQSEETFGDCELEAVRETIGQSLLDKIARVCLVVMKIQRARGHFG